MDDRRNNIVGSSRQCFYRANDARSITNYIYTIKSLKKTSPFTIIGILIGIPFVSKHIH